MKTCRKSANCCWGNCYEKNQCAYKENMTEEDICPVDAENFLIWLEIGLKERKKYGEEKF